MGMTPKIEHLNEPVISVARRDVATLREDDNVQQALDAIRQGGIGEKIVYFYVVNAQNKLVGVLPTRRLLTAGLGQHLKDIMIPRVVAIPQTATVLEACEMFTMHKFLAFPVVDEERRIVGVVDLELLAEEAFDIAEREQTDALFEAIGFRVSQVREAIPTGLPFPVPVVVGDNWQRHAVRAALRRLRADVSQEHRAGIFSDDGVGVGRKCQYSIDDGDDSNVAFDATNPGLVCPST